MKKALISIVEIVGFGSGYEATDVSSQKSSPFYATISERIRLIEVRCFRPIMSNENDRISKFEYKFEGNPTIQSSNV